MSSIKIKGPPLLEVDIHLIFSENGVWQGKWEEMQGHPETEEILSLFSYATSEELEQAGYRYPAPLMRRLGPSPEICLVKIGQAQPECSEKKYCSMYSDQCHLDLDMPLCFEPQVEDQKILPLVREVLRGWADNFYWVVIEEN